MFNFSLYSKGKNMNGIAILIIIGILCFILSLTFLIIVLNKDDSAEEFFAIFLISASGLSLLFCIGLFMMRRKFEETKNEILTNLVETNQYPHSKQVYQKGQPIILGSDQNQYNPYQQGQLEQQYQILGNQNFQTTDIQLNPFIQNQYEQNNIFQQDPMQYNISQQQNGIQENQIFQTNEVQPNHFNFNQNEQNIIHEAMIQENWNFPSTQNI